MGRDADIVVVGGGITGAATARALAQSGRGVLLLEQLALGHDRGSSHGASRIFRLSYPDAHYVRLAQGALEAWRELEDESASDVDRALGRARLRRHGHEQRTRARFVRRPLRVADRQRGRPTLAPCDRT